MIPDVERGEGIKSTLEIPAVSTSATGQAVAPPTDAAVRAGGDGTQPGSDESSRQARARRKGLALRRGQPRHAPNGEPPGGSGPPPAVPSPPNVPPVTGGLPERIGQVRTGVSRDQVIKAGAVNPGPGLRSYTAPLPPVTAAPPSGTLPAPEPPLDEPEILPDIPEEPDIPPVASPPEPGPVPRPPLPVPITPDEPVSPPEPEPVPEPKPAPPAAPQASGSARPRVRSRVLLALAALGAVLLVVVFTVIRNQGDGAAAPSTPGPSATGQPAVTTLAAAITSFDPVGGTGFRKKGDGGWVTQRYNSATFGNLKDGVGLVLDLGAAHRVSAVSFTAGSGPLAVELRAGDTPGGSEDYRKVAENATASGSTTLKGASGGQHQYWMIWVTRLGDDNTATLSTIAVKGS